jgi:hypothetical protein
MRETMMRKLAATMAVLALAGASFGAPAAFSVPPKKVCNSGNGNGSETDPANDCDPGNSGGNNNGGD